MTMTPFSSWKEKTGLGVRGGARRHSTPRAAACARLAAAAAACAARRNMNAERATDVRAFVPVTNAAKERAKDRLPVH